MKAGRSETAPTATHRGELAPRRPWRLRSWAAILSPLRSRPRRGPAGPAVNVLGSAEGRRGPSTARNPREGSARAEERDLRRNLHQGTHRHVRVGWSSPPERSESGNPAPYSRLPEGSDVRAFRPPCWEGPPARAVCCRARRDCHFGKVSKRTSRHTCVPMLREGACYIPEASVCSPSRGKWTLLNFELHFDTWRLTSRNC